MANGMSGGGDIDYEKLFNESNTVDVQEYTQFNGSVKAVNDSLDAGYLVNMNIDYQDKTMADAINRSNISFIPKYKDKNIAIHIACIGGGAGSEGDDMSAAFLATGKYRLTVNKTCIAEIDRVTIKTRDGEKEITALDLYDNYLIEIPIPIIFMSDIDLLLYSK
jgi:Fe-S cluster assembly iron-binding protein IscA